MAEDTQGPTDENNVIDMQEAKKAVNASKVAKQKKTPKSDKMDVYGMFVDAMGPGLVSNGPPFGAKFRVIADAMGIRRPVQILEEQLVIAVDEMAVRTEILRYSHLQMAVRGKAWRLDPRDAKIVYDLWASLETPLDEKEIAPVREKSAPGFTWRRLPWDFIDDGSPTPTFDELLSRTDNAEALEAWIGSLLVPSERSQYLFLHGEGRNGKGRLAAFLERVFGGAFRSEHITGRPNNFWTSGLIGARLVCFPDFEAPDFPNTGFFKMLTGEDAVRMEQKGRQAFTAQLTCKFLFLSNEAPALNESIANRRRAIYCKMLPISGAPIPAREYEARLWSEGPAWLARCVKRFRETSGFIETSSKTLHEIMDSNEEQLLDLVERWFDMGRTYEMKPGEMQEILRREQVRSGREQRKFFDFLERRYRVGKIRKGTDVRTRVYTGLRVNEAGTQTLMKGP